MTAPDQAMRGRWADVSLGALSPPAGRIPLGTAMALGLGLALAGFVLRILLQDILGSTLAFVTFYPAIALAGLVAGLPAAVVATVVSTVLGGFFFLEPASQIRPGNLMTLALFGASGAAVGVIGWQLRRTARRVGRANRRGAVLAAASSTLHDGLDRIDALEALVNLVVPGFNDWCAVELVEGVTHPVFRIAHRDPTRIHGVYELRKDGLELTGAGSSSSPDLDAPSVFLDLDETAMKRLSEGSRGLARQVGARSYVGVPLARHGRLLGYLATGMSEGDRHLEHADVPACIELGRLLSAALEERARGTGPMRRR